MTTTRRNDKRSKPLPSGDGGPGSQSWLDSLPGIARDQFAQWRLRADGPPVQGCRSLVQPVLTSDGDTAVLKISRPDGGSEHEHLVLRRWGGHGAARLLRADPHQHAVLLERLQPQSVESLPDESACEVVAGLYRQLHVPAMPQLTTLDACLPRWSKELEELPRSAPIPHRLVEQAVALCRDLAGATDQNVVLHGDLHYGKALAAQREPWLAIGPRPLNGDPHFEVAPMLWHRWGDVAGGVRDGVRQRLYTLVEAAGLDEDRARAWVLVRVVHTAAGALRAESRSGTSLLTRHVAIAKAVQD